MPLYQPIENTKQLEQYLEKIQTNVREATKTAGANVASSLSQITKNISDLSGVAMQYFTKNRDTLQRDPKALQPTERYLNTLLETIKTNNTKGEWKQAQDSIAQILKSCKSCQGAANNPNQNTSERNIKGTNYNSNTVSGRNVKDAANNPNVSGRGTKSA